MSHEGSTTSEPRLRELIQKHTVLDPAPPCAAHTPLYAAKYTQFHPECLSCHIFSFPCLADEAEESEDRDIRSAVSAATYMRCRAALMFSVIAFSSLVLHGYSSFLFFLFLRRSTLPSYSPREQSLYHRTL